MDLNNLASFICVAEQNSFTKAARKLGYSQSAISFQIKQLEKELGLPLFERINHTIRLTPKGREILELSHQIVALTNDIKNASGSAHTLGGHVRIAMADSLCHWLFWDNFDTFHKNFPDISLKIISASTEEMFQLLNRNDVDLVFTLDRHFYNTDYIIAAEHMVSAHFVASYGHPLCQKTNLLLRELTEYPFILTEKSMSYRKLLEEQLSSHSLEIKPFLEIGDTSLICHLVEQNMGLSFLPDYVSHASIEQKRLQRLHVTDFSADLWIQLLYHRDKWCSPQMQCVIDYLGTSNSVFFR